MPRNIEIKARIDSADALQPKVAAIATEGPIEIRQDDTFFRCESGRLKLRTFSATEGELIFYRRADERGPKESFYLRSPTTSPDVLRESLSLAYGQTGRVVKHRTLYLAGRTRIHLDRVRDLGHFMELEVVLKDGEPAEAGVAEAQALMTRLGIEPSRLVDTAYVDLSAPRKQPRARYDIRQLSPDDTGLLESLSTTFGEAFDEVDTYGRHRPGADYLRRLLCRDHFIALAAVKNGEVVGGIAAYELHKFEQERSEIYLYDLAVAAAHRREGIATALIRKLETIAAARKAYVIFVQADPGDDPAIALYTKLGTREDVLHFDIEVE